MHVINPTGVDFCTTFNSDMRVEIKNFSGSTLSEQLERALEEYIDSENVALVVSLPNAQVAQIEGCNPSGMVAVVNRENTADIALLPDNMFSVIAAFEIENFKSISMETLLGKIDGYVKQINASLGEGPSLDDIVMYGLRQNVGNDRRSWTPTLGGGSWTISEEKVDKYRRKHYITVEVPRLKLSQDFHDFVENQAPNLQESTSVQTSMEDIYKSVEYRNCTIAALRNARRVASVIASTIGLKLRTLPDVQALENDRFSDLPVAAFTTLRNHLQPATIYGGTITDTSKTSRIEPGIAVFHEAGSMRESTDALMPLSPLKGIIKFSACTNRAVHSIPANVGQKSTSRRIEEAEIEYIKARFFWPSKERSEAIPAKLRAEYNSEEEFLALDFIQNVASRALLKPLVTYLEE